MFGVKDITVKEKMKGILMNESSPYVSPGFEEIIKPPNMDLDMGVEYSVLNTGSVSADFGSVENFSSSSSSLTFMHPFNSTMHHVTQIPSIRNIDSGLVKNPNVGCLSNVKYEVGLCENLQEMHIADEYKKFCNNTGGFPVDPDGLLTGYNDLLSDSFRGIEKYAFSDYLERFKQGYGVRNLKGNLPFTRYSNAIGRREEVDCDYNVMQIKEQGRRYFNSGVQFQRPSVMHDTHFTPGLSDGLYSRDLSSSQLIDPAIVYDSPYDFQRMQRKGGPIQCDEAILYPSFSALPNAEEVDALSCEQSFTVDGKNSKCMVGKKSKSSKGSKKKSRDETIMKRSHEAKLVLDSQLNFGKKLESGLGLGGYHSMPGNSNADMQVMHGYLADMKGYICMIAKHQLGCRFLQRIFDEGSSEDVQAIFTEVIDHVVELMMDPFGNYLIQKMLESCTEEQMLQIVLMLTKRRGELVDICFSTHGTRVVQKLIETIKSKQQISLVMIALKPGLVDLMKDPNGNHVVQRCLQCLNNEQNKFTFDAAAKFCIDIACDRHGCCVLNRCIAYSSGVHLEKLVSSISGHGLLLAQDAFGNYVIQQIIELEIPCAIATLLPLFEGHYVHLSTQKFSSHVVEKCLRCIGESHSRIIKELLSAPHFDQLLQDRFANYVIQAALEVTKGSPMLNAVLVQAIRPYQILRSSPYCRRIFTGNLWRR